MSIKFLICDDHQVIRTGLASLLAGTEIEIVGEADSGKEALRLAQKLKPDVILLDIRMPDGDGLATLEKLRAKVAGVPRGDAVDLRQPHVHRPRRCLGRQRLRAQGLVARRHRGHDRLRGAGRCAQPHGRIEAHCRAR